MSPLSDTSDEARRVLTAAYRAMNQATKLRLIGKEFQLARAIHEAGVRRRNPFVTHPEVCNSWRSSLLGSPLWSSIQRGGPVPDQDLEPVDVLRTVVAAFETLGIAYAIGGSWASSLHGEPRMTRDADIAVEPFPGQEGRLAAHFGSDFYLSVDAARSANRERSSFNIIHTPTAFKIDVFVQKSDPFERSVLARRSAASLLDPMGQPLVWVSAEDIILLKLRWFRLGNEVSERQWSDVLGVLRVQGDRLDGPYLATWAGALGVSDLLQKARTEAET
jgi:hypothetical protein